MDRKRGSIKRKFYRKAGKDLNSTLEENSNKEEEENEEK